MIPKVIHCCWFGDQAKSPLVKKCWASWQKFAPEFTIHEWNEVGTDVPRFVREAWAARKWAFVADWMRLYVLFNEGGVYFDTDFELLAPIGDLLAGGEFVAGEYFPNGKIGPQPAVFALEPHSEIARQMLARYATMSYDGSMTIGEVLADVLTRGKYALTIFSPDVFCPIDERGRMRRTAATRGIHWYSMSWASPRRRLGRWLCWNGFKPLVDWMVGR